MHEPEDPVESTDDGCILHLYARPRASRTQIAGLHDGRIKMGSVPWAPCPCGTSGILPSDGHLIKQRRQRLTSHQVTTPNVVVSGDPTARNGQDAQGTESAGCPGYGIGRMPMGRNGQDAQGTEWAGCPCQSSRRLTSSSKKS